MLSSHRLLFSLFLLMCVTFLFCSCSDSQVAVTTESSTLESTTTTSAGESETGAAENERTTAESSSAKADYLFKSGCFYCVETNEFLFEHNAEKRIAPASLAKILTASTAYYFLGPETHFTVGTELGLLKPHSSLCLISKGQTLTLQDLTYGLLLVSGNDAAYTIAVNVARHLRSEKTLSDTEAVASFCKLMNNFALAIGMKNSNFTTPDGWDDEGQYTTAKDLCVLAKCALSSEALAEIVKTKEKHVLFVSGENITWKSSNLLLDSHSKHYNPNAVGMKTGTTQKAGNSLVAVYKKSGKTYICIVAGCKTNDSRYEAANELFREYAD